MRTRRTRAHVGAELFTPPAVGPAVPDWEVMKTYPTADNMAAAPFDTAIAEVWADGGIIDVNPSPIGGTWAYRHVNAGGGVVAENSGFILADPGRTTSNNYTEFLALLLALEALPYHWTGRVYTDSGVTLSRFQDPQRVGMKGITADLHTRLLNLRRFLGRLDFVLVGGHPTRAELGAGRRKDGKPCGIHNVWCDRACNEQKAGAIATRREAEARYERLAAPPVAPSCACALVGGPGCPKCSEVLNGHA